MFIKVYQLTLSNIIGGQCRFYPSCSNYGLQVINKYGIFIGFPKILWRILRCNPFNSGGNDPVR